MQSEKPLTEFDVRTCGQSDSELARLLLSRALQRRTDKGYTEKDVEYIRNYKQELIDKDLEIGEKDLERLRSLCKLWDVELKYSEITSHRPLIGPLIVAAKRMLFPVLKVLLKDSFKQQREFNAQTISMLTEMLNREAQRTKIAD